MNSIRHRLAVRFRRDGALLFLVWAVLAVHLALATASHGEPGKLPNNAGQLPAGGQANVGVLPGGRAARVGGRGGGANADFDSLIDLIQSTVQPDSWAENGGGEADMRPFPNGVLVDAAGTLARLELVSRPFDLGLDRSVPPPDTRHFDDPRRVTRLRYVSLPRLEREIARRQQADEPLDEAMLTMAGLERVQYVLIYPETGDLVLAGPAGDWRVTPHGRILSARTGQAVVRLDDLIVLLRRERSSPGSLFGCSITPRKEALARAQAFLTARGGQPLPPRRRDAWLSELRDTLGKQEIELFGIDPASRVALVMVEADHHMKLVGMGLEDGVAGVESYLDSYQRHEAQRKGPGPASPAVLRWWFALSYRTVRQSIDRNGYAFDGQGARVLSENELLTHTGQRVHTGQSNPLTARFAQRFTQHFELLCQKYPVYSELRGIFDLALAVSLCETEDLFERSGWQPSLLADPQALGVPQGPVPRQVESVVNYRVVNRRHFVAGVSGGVLVETQDVLRASRKTESYGLLSDALHRQPDAAEDEAWWWDREELSNEP